MARAVLLAACLVGGAAHAAKPEWQRIWTVGRVICKACNASDRVSFQKYIGMKITIEPERFINPADESCKQGVIYSDIHRRARTYAYETIPAIPEINHRHVVAGAIECKLTNGPPNIVARVVFDGSSGYYLFEGGAVFVLD